MGRKRIKSIVEVVGVVPLVEVVVAALHSVAATLELAVAALHFVVAALYFVVATATRFEPVVLPKSKINFHISTFKCIRKRAKFDSEHQESLTLLRCSISCNLFLHMKCSPSNAGTEKRSTLLNSSVFCFYIRVRASMFVP